MCTNFDERLFGQSYATLTASIRTDCRLARALALIESPGESDVSVAAMAAAACMSPTGFKRSFTRLTGFPPYQFLARYRTARAIRLLVETNLSVTEAAAESGFGDLRSFHRNFRRFVGQGPQAFRSKYGKLKVGLF